MINIPINFQQKASAPPIGAIPAALVASFLLQWIGRRLTLIFATMLYIFSWIILGTGSIHESLIAIIIARAFVGIAVGLIMPAAQIYVSRKQVFLFYLYLLRNIYCIASLYLELFIKEEVKNFDMNCSIILYLFRFLNVPLLKSEAFWVHYQQCSWHLVSQ